jgi:hypothetical protein
MKGTNLLINYLINQVIILFGAMVIIYIFKIEMPNVNTLVFILISYSVLQFLYHKQYHRDFVVDTTGVTVHNNWKAAMQQYMNYSEIIDIEFLEINFFIMEFKRVKIKLQNDRSVIINCNGIHSNEEYKEVPSFHDVYLYTKEQYDSTYFKEISISPTGKMSSKS